MDKEVHLYQIINILLKLGILVSLMQSYTTLDKISKQLSEIKTNKIECMLQEMPEGNNISTKFYNAKFLGISDYLNK